ncbi:putative nucleotide-sugar transporter [Blumeria hordei DH14]|uniref:Putative nucleotide-sugar transporter n=1 Tax=Blumeria graminis f. sp. hordei (strain DH14) TaxID=546991 RepID=N1J838_BLUG1|nr:putative nucleotide-sugar transporter [Blumeria hordei DH14]
MLFVPRKSRGTCFWKGSESTTKSAGLPRLPPNRTCIAKRIVDWNHGNNRFCGASIYHGGASYLFYMVTVPQCYSSTAHWHPLDIMEPGRSGHRRRRSSLMNCVDPSMTASKTRKKRKGPMSFTRVANEDSDNPDVELLEEGSTSEDVALDYLSDDGLHDDEETGLTGRDKKKTKQRKRRNTLLDQRIVNEHRVTDEERKEADHHVLRKSIYNKWMFDSKHLNFHFPLFTTCFHMLVQFLLSCLVLYFWPQLRPRNDTSPTPQDSDPVIDADLSPSPKPLMTHKFYLTRIGPCGIATGLDIGLGNTSLKFITLTFYTMCKSSSLAFVLLFAFLFNLENPSIRLVLIIATMTLGVLMMVAGETTFSPVGFFLVILAAFFSGFRWGLTQILLLRNPATSNPFSSIFFLAPVMFLSLILLAIPVEGFTNLFVGFQILLDEKGLLFGPLLLLFPGVIAFCMTASEFALLQRTSVVTLSIAGIFKEVVTITAAGLIFHDKLTPINISGLIITMAAIAAYNYIKIRKMREEAQGEVSRAKNDPSDSDEAAGTSEIENCGPVWKSPGPTYLLQPEDNHTSMVTGAQSSLQAPQLVLESTASEAGALKISSSSRI